MMGVCQDIGAVRYEGDFMNFLDFALPIEERIHAGWQTIH